MLREKDGEKEVGGEGISLTNQTMTRSPAAIFLAEDHILGGRPLFVALPGPSWRRTDDDELKFSQPSPAAGEGERPGCKKRKNGY